MADDLTGAHKEHPLSDIQAGCSPTIKTVPVNAGSAADSVTHTVLLLQDDRARNRRASDA
jgi:hypothetical protein